jgi:nitroimidazol reductase NimA-like FMN-containing flavoprotein (pyridoxamine 5'-phosphate oxidase superfamily)
MSVPRVLSPLECQQLIAAGGVGRVALCTPDGPQIFPVNFVVHDGSVIFRTNPYSTLGTYSWEATIAFEIDEIFPDTQQGWSVVAHGRATVDIDDALRQRLVENEPEPWAGGYRPTYVCLRWERISGGSVEGAPRNL